MTYPAITVQEALAAGGGDIKGRSERNRRIVRGALKIMRKRTGRPHAYLGELLTEYEPGMLDRFSREVAG